MRPLLVFALLLLLCGISAADGASLATALQQLSRPDGAALDRIQEVVDRGWQGGDTSVLDASLQSNAAALEMLRQAVDAGATMAEAQKSDLSGLRLLAALTLVRAEKALAQHDDAAAARDVQTLLSLGRCLILTSQTPLRVIGTSCVSHGCTLAARVRTQLSAWLKSFTLPALADIVSSEKAAYVRSATRVSTFDAQLAPFVVQGAQDLAGEYYDALLQPATRRAIQEKFDALMTRLGMRYGMKEPNRVTEMIPHPAPSNKDLGRDVAGVLLCNLFPDAYLLAKRYDAMLRALGEVR